MTLQERRWAESGDLGLDTASAGSARLRGRGTRLPLRDRTCSPAEHPADALAHRIPAHANRKLRALWLPPSVWHREPPRRPSKHSHELPRVNAVVGAVTLLRRSDEPDTTPAGATRCLPTTACGGTSPELAVPPGQDTGLPPAPPQAPEHRCGALRSHGVSDSPSCSLIPRHRACSKRTAFHPASCCMNDSNAAGQRRENLCACVRP